jgi:hypothetical protein
MNQFTATQKIMDELISIGAFHQEATSVIFQRLNMLFAVGFDEGRKTSSNQVPVLQIKDGAVIARYPSSSEAARIIKGDKGNISRCCREKHRFAYGFQWRYEDPFLKYKFE